MKNNHFLIIVITMLSGFTSFVVGMPKDINTFLIGFGMCFCFWFCMLAPSFNIKK